MLINLDELKKLKVKVDLLNQSYQVYIDWAINIMLNNNDNFYVCLLASANVNEKYEIEDYLIKLLGVNNSISDKSINEVAGSILVELRKLYLVKQLTIIDLERMISNIYIELDYPDWLVILSRNAEYATDIDYFIKPFENELNYITDLWEEYVSFDNFTANYSRERSNLNIGV